MKLLFIVYQCGKKVNSRHVFYLPFPILEPLYLLPDSVHPNFFLLFQSDYYKHLEVIGKEAIKATKEIAKATKESVKESTGAVKAQVKEVVEKVDTLVITKNKFSWISFFEGFGLGYIFGNTVTIKDIQP